MDGRFYALNRFIAPDFDLLVPDWRFCAGTEGFTAASYSYAGPVYLLFTDSDFIVLINNDPEQQRDALDMVCRRPHLGCFDPRTPPTAVREATAAEAAAGLGARTRAEGGDGAFPATGHTVWMAGATGFCFHGEPHLLTLFRLEDGRCTALATASDADRIEPIGEQ